MEEFKYEKENIQRDIYDPPSHYPDIYAACEDIDELPPQSDTNFINKTYKLPNPTVLTTEEVAEYNAIKAEYESSINQQQ